MIHLVLRICGGETNYNDVPRAGSKWSAASPEDEMGIAAGGPINQCILPDTRSANFWERNNSVCFNAQILNTIAFRTVTGMEAPETPVSAATYAEEGKPFFKIYEEKSIVMEGQFSGVKSVAELFSLRKRAGDKGWREWHNGKPSDFPVILLDPAAVIKPFRPVADVVGELDSMQDAQL